jgi:hypothetical protein
MEGVSMNPMIKPYIDLYANIAPIASPTGRVKNRKSILLIKLKSPLL